MHSPDSIRSPPPTSIRTSSPQKEPLKESSINENSNSIKEEAVISLKATLVVYFEKCANLEAMSQFTEKNQVTDNIESIVRDFYRPLHHELYKEMDYSIYLTHKIARYFDNYQHCPESTRCVALLICWIACVSMNSNSNSSNLMTAQLNLSTQGGYFEHFKMLPDIHAFFKASQMGTFPAFMEKLEQFMQQLFDIFHANETFQPIFLKFKNLFGSYIFFSNQAKNYWKIVKILKNCCTTLKDHSLPWLLFSLLISDKRLASHLDQHFKGMDKLEGLCLLIFVSVKLHFSRFQDTYQVMHVILRYFSRGKHLNGGDEDPMIKKFISCIPIFEACLEVGSSFHSILILMFCALNCEFRNFAARLLTVLHW